MVFAPSPRQVSLQVARRICLDLPPYVDRVGVFLDASEEKILEVLQEVPLTRIQLHGQEPAGLAARIPVAVTRALACSDVLESQMQEWLQQREDVHFLVDLPKNSNDLRPQDLWQKTAPLARKLPLTLAGGLNPDNILEALTTVRPAAVDVARGVESQPTEKNHAAVRAFIDAVLAYDAVKRETA
jgi:phosphoribosylanthranilate isomerase